MKISTTTGVYQQSGGAGRLRDMDHVLEVLRGVGYSTIDLGFCMQDEENYILAGDDWEKKIDRLGETAAKLGIDFYQSHTPFVPGCSMYTLSQNDPDYEARYREFLRRACIANGRLGVKWSVIHPMTYPQFNYERKASLEQNHAFFDPYVELCIRGGTGVAYENMLPSLNRQYPVRYCQHYDDLIELVDSYGDPMVGLCWDTGHANQMKLDQGRALRTIGSRLVALHLNDNAYNTADEHLLPFMGGVDWPEVIRALVEIGYQGSLNYETAKVSQRGTGDMQLELVKMIYRSSLCFAQLYEREKAAQGK